mgnify:CR=1 FL=1
MSLIPAKCPNCGGNIRIDSEKRASICEYCKQPFVTEDVVNNYNTYNQNTYSVEHADLHIQDEKGIESQLVRADTVLNILNKPNDAFYIYKELTESHPQRYEGWWGAAMSSIMFRKAMNPKSINPEDIKYAKGWVDTAVKVADPGKKEELKNQWNDFIRKIKSDTENRSDQKIKYNHLLEEREKILAEKYKLVDKKKTLENRCEKVKRKDCDALFYYPYYKSVTNHLVTVVVGFVIWYLHFGLMYTIEHDIGLLLKYIGIVVMISPVSLRIINFILSVLAIPSREIANKNLKDVREEIALLENQISELDSDYNNIDASVNQMWDVIKYDDKILKDIDNMLLS